MTDRILLIEDDPRLAEMVKSYLGEAGFRVSVAGRGDAGIAHVKRASRSMSIILDLMLPDMDGLEVCRRIRARAPTPILMLTARGDAMDRVVGLELGADDYLPKPFEPRELLARLRAILRRSKAGERQDMLRFGRLEIDTGARSVRLDGEPRTLTSHQFALLLVLAQHAGRVLSRDVIMDLLKQRAAGSVRPLDRRAHLAHPRRDRGRSEEAAPRHHRARRRLCVRQGAGLKAACAGSIRRSISRSSRAWCWW